MISKQVVLKQFLSKNNLLARVVKHFAVMWSTGFTEDNLLNKVRSWLRVWSNVETKQRDRD